MARNYYIEERKSSGVGEQQQAAFLTRVDICFSPDRSFYLWLTKTEEKNFKCAQDLFILVFSQISLTLLVTGPEEKGKFTIAENLLMNFSRETFMDTPRDSVDN